MTKVVRPTPTGGGARRYASAPAVIAGAAVAAVGIVGVAGNALATPSPEHPVAAAATSRGTHVQARSEHRPAVGTVHQSHVRPATGHQPAAPATGRVSHHRATTTPRSARRRGTPATTSAAGCVSDDATVLSHTFKGRTAVITMRGLLPLCTPLDVEGVSWKFEKPHALFPQRRAGMSPVLVISAPGRYVVSAPSSCGQRDVYARPGGAPGTPLELIGHNQPYEPRFLSDYSRGPHTYPGSTAGLVGGGVP